MFLVNCTLFVFNESRTLNICYNIKRLRASGAARALVAVSYRNWFYFVLGRVERSRSKRLIICYFLTRCFAVRYLLLLDNMRLFFRFSLVSCVWCLEAFNYCCSCYVKMGGSYTICYYNVLKKIRLEWILYLSFCLGESLGSVAILCCIDIGHNGPKSYFSVFGRSRRMWVSYFSRIGSGRGCGFVLDLYLSCEAFLINMLTYFFAHRVCFGISVALRLLFIYLSLSGSNWKHFHGLKSFFLLFFIFLSLFLSCSSGLQCIH